MIKESITIIIKNVLYTWEFNIEMKRFDFINLNQGDKKKKKKESIDCSIDSS